MWHAFDEELKKLLLLYFYLRYSHFYMGFRLAFQYIWFFYSWSWSWLCCIVAFAHFLSSLSHLYYYFIFFRFDRGSCSISVRTIFVFSLFRGLLSIFVVISWAICHRFIFYFTTSFNLYQKRTHKNKRARKMEFILIHLPSNECFTSKSLIKSKSSTRWLNHENEKNEHGTNSSSENSCKILRERERKIK